MTEHPATYVFCYAFVLFSYCCYQSSGYVVNMTSYFGSKAPYPRRNKINQTSPPPCEAIHLNVVLRHGARYPSSGDRKKLQSVVELLNSFYGSGPNFTYGNLTLPREYPDAYKKALPSELSRLGETEHYNIAIRYLSRFPKILSLPYSNGEYSFLSSNKERTTQSASSFGFGLFQGRGELGSDKFQPVALEISSNIRFYDNCKRYEKESETAEWLREYFIFQQGPEMKKVKDNLERRLGLSGKLELTIENVLALFRMCQFGVIAGNDRAWCDLFKLDDLRVLQYLDDLEKHYESSYGHETNYKISCPLLRDILENLKGFIENSRPRGVFRFGHSQTVLPLLSMLGLFRDSPPLRADNFRKESNRKLWTARVVPMAANVAFVLYGCKVTPKHRIQVMVNEVIVPTEACNGAKTCSLETFLGYYNNTLRNCDAEFKRLCSLPTTGAASTIVNQYTSLIVVLLFKMYALCGEDY